jgi:hypothetical protein
VPIKNRQQLLVLLALSAVVLFAGEHLVYEPLATAWTARQARITELERNLSNGRALVRRETGITNHWATLLGNSLTNNQTLAEAQLFRAIDSWGQNSGVTITAITPQWKRDNDEYMTLECRVEAAGDIDHLTRFLYRAEREALALRLESVELGARDKAGRQMTLGLQFSGLALLPPPQNAPAGLQANSGGAKR